MKTTKTTDNKLRVGVNYNAEKSGIELTFTEKPSEDVRNRLKGWGMRWSRFQGLWYFRDTPENRKKAQLLVLELNK